MKFADLHIHSYFSDGTFSPKEIVKEALRAGLDCISITDHDTIAGIDPVIKEATGTLEIIPGIEMTAEISGQEVHILGYFIDYRDKDFLQMLEKMQEARTKRIYGICEKLKKLKVDIEPESIFALAGKGSIGRLHVARALVEKGCCSSVSEAFVRYIGDRGPAYVGKLKMTPAETIKWIKKVKGIPVLAHPFTLGSRFIISDFVKDGIMGIEAYYAEHSDFQEQEFIKIAKKYDLLITGGSDCHGEAKDEINMGKIKLPYEYVEKLKEARGNV
ncbi:MAG TPA: PHP domain-containing protein [Candidatus Omnitrophota bacterium]|nr:PHP domain-containing protein [Candidatus Omnitrophota bacterium]